MVFDSQVIRLRSRLERSIKGPLYSEVILRDDDFLNHRSNDVETYIFLRNSILTSSFIFYFNVEKYELYRILLHWGR